MKRIIVVATAAVLLAPIAHAASPLDVVINEVAWMGSDASYEDEWIELYNNTGAAIDLTGWTIADDVDASIYNLSGSIPANGYFLIERREEATSVAADLIEAGMNLGNSGDSLELFDESANSIDLLETAGGWYAGTNNSGGTQDVSMERLDTTEPGNNPDNWADNDGVIVNGTDSAGTALNATPGAENSVAGPIIVVPEIVNLHCVDASHLMVLFNTGLEAASAETAANYTVGLLGGGSEVNPATATLDGADTSIVHLEGIAGFSAEDLLTLEVQNVQSDTGGDSGTISEDFVAGVVTIAFARDDADVNYVPDLLETHPAIWVTVSGLVNAAGVFYYQEATMQDVSGGITIFGATAEELTRGDEIRISGKLDQYNGKDELVDTWAVELSTGNAITPMVLTLAELNAAGAGELYESMLVGVAQVSNTGAGDAWPADGDDANVEISDDGGTNTFVMRIDSDTDLDGTAEPSWPVDAAGVASQFDFEDPPDGGYQLLPRDQNDIGLSLPTCNDGDTRPCYSGDPADIGVGVCAEGTESCVGGDWSGSCEGEVLPAADDSLCNELDDDCDGDTDEDVDFGAPETCGSCDNDCTDDYANAAGLCDAGTCSMGDCDAGFADCNTDAADGCEVELGSDTNCSACGDDCTDDYDNAAGFCDAGACAMGDCDAGYGDCNADAADGCETALGTDANCSACGDDCDAAFANASGSCVDDGGFGCQFEACAAGYGDCNADTADGCETALTSTANCGACGNACGQGESCIDTGNGYECSSDCPDADGDGYADEECGGADCADDDDAVYPGADELCDDVDNDCDGDIDEDYPDKGAACDGPDADECANGTYVCNAAGDDLECEGDTPQTEACDGLDNDCDGEVDEDWPSLGEACDGDDSDECANGQLVCNAAGNGVTCNETPNQNQEETCNGEDDDCDGEIDEGFGQFTCGVGACENTVDQCIDGEWQDCVALERPEQVEVSCADGIDNDCDGFVDDNDLDCSDGGGDDGCGCAASGNQPGGLLALMLLGLALVARRRR